VVRISCRWNQNNGKQKEKKNKERRRIQLDRQKKEKIDAHRHNTRCSAEDNCDIGSRQMVEEEQDVENPNYQLLKAKNQRKKTPIKEEGQMRGEIKRGRKKKKTDLAKWFRCRLHATGFCSVAHCRLVIGTAPYDQQDDARNDECDSYTGQTNGSDTHVLAPQRITG
jgi:hypothetical protein